MRHLKILGLLGFAVLVPMSVAASASATYVSTFTGGGSETPTVHTVNEGGHISLANSSANIECDATVEGWVVSHGSGEAASADITNVGGGTCTNGWSVSVNTKGSVSVTHTSGHNGTLNSTGATVTAVRHTIFGTNECRYSTSNTHLGTITGGYPATVKLEGKIPFHSGGGLCGSGSSQLSGNLVTTGSLYVSS